MAANPNPARITAAMWWFGEQLLALEPGTLLAGIYANKPGYHNTRAANATTDYSVRDTVDQRGPSDKAAAIDWTFPEAQRGDYRRMAVYGWRLRAAYDARDPRLAGWREALGQVDVDATPEGLDFRYWRTRTPDDTHLWHWHFSECREVVTYYSNKGALLSVLRGQTYEQWRAGETDMLTPEQAAQLLELHTLATSGNRLGPAQTSGGGIPVAWWPRQYFELRAEFTLLRTALEGMAAGSPDAAAILAGVDERLATLRAEIRDAVADLGEGGAAAVRADA